MSKCHTCELALCVSCREFEKEIESIDDVVFLKDLRIRLMNPKFSSGSPAMKVADWIVNKVSTLKFFSFCIVLSLWPVMWKTFLPNLWPSVQEDVLFISNTFQLTLLPVILIAGARASQLSSERAEREYRMLLLSERIDELERE